MTSMTSTAAGVDALSALEAFEAAVDGLLASDLGSMTKHFLIGCVGLRCSDGGWPPRTLATWPRSMRDGWRTNEVRATPPGCCR